jgi:hypothetical protein
MPKYLFVYHGGDQPASKEEGDKVMAEWNSWVGQVGKSMIDIGNPTGNNRTVAPNGSVTNGASASSATGYSIIEAPDLDGALNAAKMCPQLKSNGSVEVAEILPLM